jgi:hypothetical protein
MTTIGSLLLGQVRSAAQSVVEKVTPQLPPLLQKSAQAMAQSVDEFVSHSPLLAQLGGTTGPLPPLTSSAQVSTEYKKAAASDLLAPSTLKALNDDLKKQDPTAKPLTRAEVSKIIQDTDVKLLAPAQYAALKAAAGPGSPANPATSLDGENRAKLKENGPTNLAKSRLRASADPATANREPTADEVAKAEADLRAIDPGIFNTPPRDVIYVNQTQVSGAADPRRTKVAAHEFVHHILNHRQFAGDQHVVIGRLGWNGSHEPNAPVDDTRNWSTPPGSGLP